ncbi:MAG: PKD domain-containing protein [Saprospiraceae bacterium]|nr:PKD domain-containing protein [Saprospiraceae bacterium]
MRHSLILIAALFLSIFSLDAQSVKIFGYVYNTDKKPVADWPVTILTSPATNAAGVRLQTNADGFYVHEFKLNPNVAAYLVNVSDPCQVAPQVQKAPGQEGKYQLDFVICAKSDPAGDPCDGKFDFAVHQDGWVEFHASAATERVEYFWEFGDGTSGSGKDVRHQYNAPGVYVVNLIITNGTCKKLYTFKIEVKDSTPPPPTSWNNECCGKVNISSATLNTSAGNGYNFKATAGFPIKEVSWDFGDGTTGTGVEVRHVYAKEGKYKVTTKITGEFCTVILTTWIHVGRGTNADPCAGIDFAFATDQLSAKFRADLKGKTAERIKWDFGDGTGSTDAETSHTYAKAGVYKVTFYVVIDGKLCQVTKEVKVGGRTDPNSPCNYDFKFSVDQLTIKLEAGFNAAPDKFYWDLGDGNTSSDFSVKHTYAKAGTYVVTLYYVINGVECKVSKKITVGGRIGNKFDIVIYDVSPNPAVDDVIVSIKSSDKAEVTLVVSDVTGVSLLKSRVALETGDNKVPMSLVNLKSGTYIVYLYHENQVVSKALFQKL